MSVYGGDNLCCIAAWKCHGLDNIHLSAFDLTLGSQAHVGPLATLDIPPHDRAGRAC